MSQAHNDSIAYLNGDFRRLGDCLVPINLHTLQYGTGCFEGIRGYWDAVGKRLNLLFLQEHFLRLQGNARMLMMESPSIEEMCAITQRLIVENRVDYNIYIRPVVYKNCTDLGPRLNDLPNGFLCYTLPLEDYLDTTNGLKLCISSWTRIGDNQVPTRAKATGIYINSALAKTEARLNGFDEALFLNVHSEVCEGSAENVFIVRDGVLITPDRAADILEGITRAAVIDLAADLGIPCIERRVARTELYRADEVFLVGTGCQISWVASIDHRVIGAGVPGPITIRIRETYDNAVYGRDPARSHWLTPVV